MEVLGFKPTAWLAIILCVGATVLMGFGKMDSAQWQEFVTYIFLGSAGKTAIVEGSIAFKKGDK